MCYCHPCRVQTPFHLIVPFASVPVPPLLHEASSYVHPVSPSLRAPPKWAWLWLMPLVGPRYHPAWRLSLDLLVLGGTGRRADPEPFAPCFRNLHSPGVTPSKKAQPPPIQHLLFTNSRSPQIMVPAGNDSNNNNSFPPPPTRCDWASCIPHLTEGEIEAHTGEAPPLSSHKPNQLSSASSSFFFVLLTKDLTKSTYEGPA